MRQLGAQIGQTHVTIGDFSHLPTHCKFLALMPQWEFLNFLAEKAKRFPCFQLKMEAEVTELLQEGDRVVGVRAKTPQGVLEIRADLTAGADGRHSIVRRQAWLQVIDLGAPMDVLWMRISRRPDDPEQTFGHAEAGRILITINRDDYWQCALVIPKEGFEEIRRNGLPRFRQTIVDLAPFLESRVSELRDWDDIKLLTVAVDRLRHWSRPGLLCIGDAAHAMSPIGGVGINLAVQDAVAAANILAAPLRNRSVSDADLRAVERRRELPTRLTQMLQVAIQNRVIRRVLASTKPMTAPFMVRMLDIFPVLRRIPARLVGLGFRPEHIR